MFEFLFKKKKRTLEQTLEPIGANVDAIQATIDRPRRNYVAEAAAHVYKAPVSISQELLPCEMTQEFASYDEMRDGKYPRIDTSFLSWVKMDGEIPVPVFAVYNPFKAGVCQINLTSFSSSNIFYSMGCEWFGYSSITERSNKSQAHPLFAPYANWAEKYEEIHKGHNVVLSSQFSGIIPDATRKKIKEAKKEFKDVAIIAEAAWKVSKTPNLDPLVIGVQGRTCWLIDKFDLTPIERIAASEFAYNFGDGI